MHKQQVKLQSTIIIFFGTLSVSESSLKFHVKNSTGEPICNILLPINMSNLQEQCTCGLILEMGKPLC